VIRYIPALIWALVILVLSITPAGQLPEANFNMADKLAHLLVYMVLSVLLWYALVRSKSSGRKAWKMMGWVVGFGIVYGVAIELIQAYFISSRYGEVEDAIANGLGSVFGLIVGKTWIKGSMFHQKNQRNEKNTSTV
jgi:VanZ family protein